MASPSNIPKLALSALEVAEALGICKTKAYDLINTGEIPSVSIGSKRLVPVDLLRKYLRQQDISSNNAGRKRTPCLITERSLRRISSR
jgi:excisionase family DNA binding protein